MANAKDPSAKDKKPRGKGATKHGDNQRPAGTSDTRNVTGVDPKKIITRDNPAG